ncbi:MAG: hypothetical protein U0520_01235 [Candidatus Saccharimonadales bacterium]
MGLKDFANKIQKAANDYKDAQVAKKEAEEQRKNDILAGKIQPIQVTVNLEPGEKAYAAFNAKRMADRQHIVETTTGKSKKKGVITRGIVGGVLLGPVGLVAGAATAGGKSNMRTTQQTVTRLEAIDQGTLIFTSKRLMFLGSQVVSLPYSKLIGYNFEKNKMVIRYENMEPNEQYVVSGNGAGDIQLYYQGITANLVKKDVQEVSSSIKPMDV